MGESTSKLAERYQIVDAMENTFKAGYKWEVVDTATDNVMCATPTHELDLQEGSCDGT